MFRKRNNNNKKAEIYIENEDNKNSTFSNINQILKLKNNIKILGKKRLCNFSTTEEYLNDKKKQKLNEEKFYESTRTLMENNKNNAIRENLIDPEKSQNKKTKFDSDNKFFGYGPIIAPKNIRSTCRFDYAPGICKDFKETGYCGFGDTCIFVHDRSDYKLGWELEQEWNKLQREKELKKIKEGKYYSSDDDSSCECNNENEDDKICKICNKEFVEPVVISCNHIFCEKFICVVCKCCKFKKFFF